MNISSAVVKTIPEKTHEVKDLLEASDLCEVHLCEKGKIIIVIEAETIDKEILNIRQIEKIDGVLSVELVYSYSEDELEKERANIELSKDIPDWLNDDSLKAGQIPYFGDLKRKI